MIIFGSAVALASATVEVGAGAAQDLPDPISGEYASFLPAPVLDIAGGVVINDQFRLTIGIRSSAAFGSDRVRWTQGVEGRAEQFANDDHWTMLSRALLRARFQFDLTTTRVRPIAAIAVGGGWAGTYHTFDQSLNYLVDPAYSPTDVFSTHQAIGTADLSLGVRYPLHAAWTGTVSVGYEASFLPGKALNKMVGAYKVQREPIFWNAVTLDLGFAWASPR